MDIDHELWALRGVSIQGIVAGTESSQAAFTTGLFGKPEIPLSYMRSCLLSPKFYNVVNHVLAQMLSSPSQDVSA